MKREITILLILCLLLTPIIIAPGIEEIEEEYENDEYEIESIFLEGERNIIEWETKGHSENGFKIVWSKNENPEYPTRNGDRYHYHSNPEKERDELTAFDGEGIYHVRVCEYLGGECGIYSNEIKLELMKDYEDNDEKDDDGKEEYENESYYEKEDTDKLIPELYCSGCKVKDRCYPIGHRISGQYCSNDLTLINQTTGEETCENSFECSSNVCVSGECLSEGFIRKFLSWFKKIFN